MRLQSKVDELSQEVESLRDTVAHLGESLASALANGAESAASDEKSETGEWVCRAEQAGRELESSEVMQGNWRPEGTAGQAGAQSVQQATGCMTRRQA